MARPISASRDLVPTVLGGSVSLSGSNTYSGSVIVSGSGSLFLQTSNATFNASQTLSALNISSGAVTLFKLATPPFPRTLVSDALLSNVPFTIDTTVGPIFANTQTLTGLTITPGATVTAVGNLTTVPITGQWTLGGGVLSLNTGTALTISGTANLVKNGAGTLVLEGGTFFTGDALDGSVLVNSTGTLTLTGGANMTLGTPVVSAAPAAVAVPEPGSAILLAIGAFAASQVRRRRTA